jgi:O-antigen/teichoic acid export membrane protein
MASVALFANEALHLLVHERFHSAYLVIPLLLLGGFFRSASIIPYTRLLHERKVPYALATLVPTAAVQLGLAWILTPRLGIIGAAIGSAAAYLTALSMQMYWAKRFTSEGSGWSRGHAALIFGSAVLVTLIATVQPSDLDWRWSAGKLGLLAAIAAGLAMLEQDRVRHWSRIVVGRLAKVAP